MIISRFLCDFIAIACIICGRVRTQACGAWWGAAVPASRLAWMMSGRRGAFAPLQTRRIRRRPNAARRPRTQKCQIIFRRGQEV
jgi:hypothetical protein